MSTRKATQRIILHHADAKNCSAEDIHRWHLNNGWSGAGYHFLVRKDGKVYRLRPEEKVGAHAYGSNYNSLGVCFEGDYMVENMPAEQIKAGQELVTYLKNKYNITTVQAHRDVCATSCPGDKFPFNEIAKSETSNEIISQPQEKVEKSNVARIQATLNDRYGLNIAVDNIYGNETKKALVKGLQTELNEQYHRGLIVDGIFGANTYNACINVRKGAEGNITYLIQAMLVCHSFDIDADGIFGPATKNAVKNFQSRNGLSQDGIVGKNTFNKLFK
ncbi:MAG: N-acetylmuramoyl-L-alanine amidase [Clostridium sp.]|nr:N-acetylmuramoyl-L-alanine amidase [Clostridium sp.]